MDTRIRKLDKSTWRKFKVYCKWQAKKRKKNISCNTMLLEMVDMVVNNLPLPKRSHQKKALEERTTMDFQVAYDKFDVVINCGKCYCFYDGLQEQGICPLCGSDKWVGSR